MTVPAQDKRTDLVTLGSAEIWYNGVHIGHVKGDVSFTCERTYVGFKPANMLGEVVRFRTGESYKLTCQAAELSLKNIKTALGVTTSITASYVPTGYDNSLSFEVTPATDKWDSIVLGGSKTLDDAPLMVVHTRPNGNQIVILLYKVQCVSNLDLTFKEEDISMQTLEFTPLAVSTRAIGDQVGIMFVQTA